MGVGKAPENATWESLSTSVQTFPSFHFEDKVLIDGMGSDTISSRIGDESDLPASISSVPVVEDNVQADQELRTEQSMQAE